MFNAVILSGLPGSGKTSLQHKLADFLGWHTYSVGEIYRKRWQCESSHLSFEEWYRQRSVGDLIDINEECQRVLDVGNVVADGRYVAYCGPNVLRVFLTADLHTRALRADSSKYRGKPTLEIERILNYREQDEFLNGRKLFENKSICEGLGIKPHEFYDYRDPSHYHLVLNSAKLSLEKEFELVKKLIEA